MNTKLDNRHLTPEQQEILRIKAVEAVLSGEKQASVARIFGVSRWSVCQWMKKSRKKGVAVLAAKRRGGRKSRLLDARQSEAIVRTLQEKEPSHLDLPFSLWTREAVKALIERELGVKLAIRTIGTYLQRWGLTPQKPLARAYEQNPEAVQQWLKKEYPRIQAQAKAENGLILWGDEMGLRSQHQAGRSYGQKGQTPVVGKTGKRFGYNMIAAISNLGKLYFSLYDGSFKSTVFIGFLEKLLRQMKGRKVFLILDGYSVHQSEVVNEWLKGKEALIELFFLPTYSPELNPEELLNHEIKATVFRTKRPRTKKELKALLKSKLYSLQRQPEKIKACFKAKHTLYAAA